MELNEWLKKAFKIRYRMRFFLKLDWRYNSVLHSKANLAGTMWARLGANFLCYSGLDSGLIFYINKLKASTLISA